jgi:hypothetical protein
MVADCDRLKSGKTCFHQAAVIAVGRLLAQVVAEVHFDAGDLFAETVEGIADDGANVFIKASMNGNGLIGINIDLHTIAPVFLLVCETIVLLLPLGSR